MDSNSQTPTNSSQVDIIQEVSQHYRMWNEDNTRQMTRKNGWNDITDAYYGKLPNDWPYLSKVVDPKIRTSLIEKNARLLNAKLRGRLVPRESGDEIGALLNNAVLDYQWDSANDGGSMLTKFEISDIDTRLYGSKFAYVYWKYEEDADGKCVFDGNELTPLDIRDSGIDPTATHIRDAKWFQFRTFEAYEDLVDSTDADGKPIYQNLGKLKASMSEKLGLSRSSTRTTDYVPRIKTLKGLQDRTGEDLAFPVVKVVTEFRKDRWITFCPDYNLILRDIPNPYKHGKIPIAQLRYYPLQDEPLGESEVESVLGLWRAIQMTICAYLDEVVLKIRPPLKIIENAARIETIEYGPEAQWLVDRQDAVEEMRSSGDALQYFQTTYQALLSAFNVAMGDISQQTSVVNPFGTSDKTATEVKASLSQQSARDQKNQNDLADFIEDIMLMWLENNKQFLFSDPEKLEYVIRIVGKDKFDRLQQAGLDGFTVMPQTLQTIADIVYQHPEISDTQLHMLYEAGKLPNYPVVLNPKEKDPEKLQLKPKMKISDNGNIADVSLTPEDLQGTYDYIADVKSMSLGAQDTLIQSRQRAIDRLTTNPLVLQLLQQEGYQPNIKELLSADFEDTGLNDADRFFSKIPTQAGASQMGGAQPNSPVNGLPGIPQANSAGGIPQQMAGPNSQQNPGGIPQAVRGGMGQGNGLQGNVQLPGIGG